MASTRTRTSSSISFSLACETPAGLTGELPCVSSHEVAPILSLE